jgi:hypothetical protein
MELKIIAIKHFAHKLSSPYGQQSQHDKYPLGYPAMQSLSGHQIAGSHVCTERTSRP